MTIDDAIAIQRQAFEGALASLLAAEGLAPPPCFSIEPTASGNVNVHLATGPLALNYPHVMIDRGWSVRDVGHVRPEVLDDILEGAHLSIRRAAQTHEKRSMPSWAVLAHPLLLAVLLAHEPDRSRMPVRGETSCDVPGGRWDIDAQGDVCHAGTVGNATADAWLADGVMQTGSVGVLMRMGVDIACVTVQSVPHVSMPAVGHTSIAIPTMMPETILSTLPRRLGDLVGLPATGHPDVDRAAADCIVTGYKDLANGLDLEIAPARLIPYGVAPTPALVRAMDLAPVVA